MRANDKQIDGKHYQGDVQPWDAIIAWELGFLDGCAVKYLARWRKKGGVQDLMKAIHFIEKLIEVENGRTHNPHATDRKTAETIPQADAEARVEGRFEYGRIFDSRGKVTVERNEPRDYQPKDLGDLI